MTDPGPVGIRVDEGSGPIIDTFQVTLDDGSIVQRERVSIAGTDDLYADVIAEPPALDAAGLVVRNVGTISLTTANNTVGELMGVSVGTTVQLVSLTAGDNYKLHGFLACGNADGYFVLTVDETKQVSGRSSVMEKTVQVAFPLGVSVAQGSLVELWVTNEGLGPADFDGAIFGE